MKVVIAGSVSLQAHISTWLDYWRSRDCEVIDYPVKIDPATFGRDYPKVYKAFFDNLLTADMLFVLNEDKHGIEGYIGAETFSEMGFAVANNQLGKINIEVVLMKMPSDQVQSIDEINLWLKLGWVTLFDSDSSVLPKA